jgi:RimJ/RimL family protein N-acetyltransferase
VRWPHDAAGPLRHNRFQQEPTVTESTRARADIIPYTPEYEQQVRGWIDSEETYRNVCQGIDFPPPEDIIASWQRVDVASYILLADRRPVAYGELWDRPVEMAKEIGHLLVDPYRRSRGYGSLMLNLLFNRAASRPGVHKVMLHLFGGDEVVLGCYLKAGFELIGTTPAGSGLKMIRLVE